MNRMSIPADRLLSLFIPCLVTAMLSHFSKAEEPARLQFPPPEINRDWIAAELDREQLTYLEGEQKFFSLFAEEQWGQAKGAVLIIPDPDEIPWPAHLLELHAELSKRGWHSLIISLPLQTAETNANGAENTPDSGETAATDPAAAANDDNPNNAASADPYGSAVLQRISAAIEYLHTKGQFNIAVAASGRSGEYAEKFLERRLIASHENGVNPLQAVILINAEHQDTSSWVTEMAKLPLPILDIYHDSANSKQAAQARRSKFKRQRKFAYHQVALPKPLPDKAELSHRLARRCRGWLDQQITGMEARNLVKIR